MSTIWQSVTWDIARAGGFTAYILLTLAVVVGLALMKVQVESAPSQGEHTEQLGSKGEHKASPLHCYGFACRMTLSTVTFFV